MRLPHGAESSRLPNLLARSEVDAIWNCLERLSEREGRVENQLWLQRAEERREDERWTLGRGNLTKTGENCGLVLTELTVAEQMCVLSVRACTQYLGLSA